MTQTVLTLPFPPSVNHYWQWTARSGKPKAFVGDKGRAYRRRVAEARLIQRPACYPTERLAVLVEAQGPTRASYDVDNVNKCLLDALTHAGVWTDDSQIDDLRVVRGPVRKGGRVVVTIRPVELQTAREGGR